jgi:hypothetical protein
MSPHSHVGDVVSLSQSSQRPALRIEMAGFCHLFIVQPKLMWLDSQPLEDGRHGSAMDAELLC